MSQDSRPQDNSFPVMRHTALRVLFALTVAFVSLLSLWQVGLGGASRFLASYGATVNLLPPVVKAVELSPADPEAHYLLAAMLAEQGNQAAAIKEYEQALALRPDDYVFWLELATARDSAGDANGALMAAKEAVRLAPFYGQPRWLLGNLLLRAGEREAAFTELRDAARKDTAHLPTLIDLAWNVRKGDVKSVEQSLQPTTHQERLALARFFIKRGETAAAVAQFRASGALSATERRQWIGELIAAKRFPEAYELWRSERSKGETAAPVGGQHITNGGFEEEIKTEGVEFDWSFLDNRQAVAFALDGNAPVEGAQSLRLEFKGTVDASTSLLTQLVVVEPNTRYRLRFMARTQELKTGGPPLVVIGDASSKENRELSQSPPLLPDLKEWREYVVEFQTGAETLAVLVKLRRQPCSTAPCPIFGLLWLDNFSLQKL